MDKMKVFIQNSEKKGWCVSYGEKYAEYLGYDEMIGLVISITIPENKPCLQWLKTKEQHQQQEEYFNILKTNKNE